MTIAQRLMLLVGAALATAGWTIATGGYSGVMEAASRGAQAADLLGQPRGAQAGLLDQRRHRSTRYAVRDTRYAEMRMVRQAVGHSPGASSGETTSTPLSCSRSRATGRRACR